MSKIGSAWADTAELEFSLPSDAAIEANQQLLKERVDPVARELPANTPEIQGNLYSSEISRQQLLDACGIAIKRHTSDTFIGQFMWELSTVASATVALDEPRLRQNELVATGEPQRQLAFSALIGSIVADQQLAFVHSMRRDEQGRPCYVMRIEGAVMGANVGHVMELALALHSDVRAALITGCPQFGFKSQPPQLPSSNWPRMHDRDLCCAAVTVGSGQAGRVGFAETGPKAIEIALPFAPKVQRSFLDSVIPTLLAAPVEMELRVEFAGRTIADQTRQQLASLSENICSIDFGQIHVIGGGGDLMRPTSEELKAIQTMLRGWCAKPTGADMRVRIRGEGRIPDMLVTILGTEILQGRPFSLNHREATPVDRLFLDLSAFLPSSTLVPALFPGPGSLARLGFPRHYGDIRLRTAANGVVLGDITMPFMDEVVRIADVDRSQHCYVIGSTGTGKSTLLQNMICQDIKAGRGVAVLDPHGDLYWQVLEQIPAERANDVVLIDFTDFDHVPGLNLLEIKSARKDLERNFIIQDLTAIFKRLYGNVPESMGPMFFLYMRNAVALVMEDPVGETTILDVPRVFSDIAFRDYLLKNCKDAAVTDFWLGIAGPMRGDHSLREMAPYITNKFTEFTQNDLVRNIVGQPKTSFDLRKIMDSRMILLVNLSKGLLSELDTRFLGMLLTSRLFAAAATRAALPTNQRIPFHVYIDEFQNFTSDSLSSSLAESRKYGLAITLAHQDFGQVPGDLKSSLMANTGSKIFFRIGAQDAETLAQYVAPHHSAQELMTLPDHHAMARIKVLNVPSPPFVLRTRAADEQKSGADAPSRRRMIEHSRDKYSTSAGEIRKILEASRRTHLSSL